MRLILPILLFSVAVQAQKIKKNEIDEFTGDRVVQTSRMMLFMKGMYINGAFSIRHVSGVSFFDFEYNSGEIVTIRQDDKIIFILDDGNTYELTALQTEISNTNIVGNITTHQARLSYANMSDPKLEGLTDRKVKKMRVYFSNGYRDFEIKDKNQENLMNTLLLVKKSLQ